MAAAFADESKQALFESPKQEGNYMKDDLTRREQEIPHFYKWWDELR